MNRKLVHERSRFVDRMFLYVRTARHLRWRQGVYRAINVFRRRAPVHVSSRVPELDTEAVARLAAVLPAWGPADPEACIERAEGVIAGRFRFLNHEEELPAIDWNRGYANPLWTYNLHYFDFGVDLAWAYRRTGHAGFRDAFERLVDSWIRGAAPGRSVGWDPYPVSVRAMNWTYALVLFGDALSGPIRQRLGASLHAQLAFLDRRLEWHILANHLWKNYAALAVGGLVFTDRPAWRWRRKGGVGLSRQIAEQVLPDGGHYERSPMYHAACLNDALQAVALRSAVGEPVPEDMLARLRGMARATGMLGRPDGRLHLFNDAANGIAPSIAELDRLATAVLGVRIPAADGPFALDRTGYYGMSDPASGDRLIVDCGEPGPAYQPGHAHCDLLSYELDLGGRQTVVDSGVCGYAGDPLREYVRSTRAHNTVAIAGQDQSEMWGAFRVARRAQVLEARHEAGAGVYRFAGSYAPYHDRRAVHDRHLTWRPGRLDVTDRVRGATGARLDGYIHLHPELKIERDGHVLRAHRRGQALRIEVSGADEVRIRCGGREPVQGWYCPEFGKAVPAPVIEMVVHANDGREFGYTLRAAEAG